MISAGGAWRSGLLAVLLLSCAGDPEAAAEPDASPTDAGSPDTGSPDTGSPDKQTPVARLEAPPTALLVFEDGSLALERGGQPRLQLPAGAIELGVVDALSPTFNYDPWYLFGPVATARPPGLRWVSPVSAHVEPEAAGLLLHLEYPELGEGRLQMSAEGDRIAAVFTPPAGPIAYVRVGLGVARSEDFYGLGSALDTPAHRGKIRALQLELDLRSESTSNEANVPVPFLIGTTGWGIFVEDDHPMVFDVAATDPERVEIYVAGVDGPGDGPAPRVAPTDALRFHLFTADHPLDVTRSLYQVTGRPRLPAPWALGPWVWRDENRDQAQVISDLEIMRALDLPATGVWVDRPYSSGVSSFDFRPDLFPDPGAMIARAHALGFRFALWHTAYVGEDQEATAALHAQAEAAGYYPPRTGPIVNRWGRPVDLTNPDAYRWWQALIERYTALGVEGFKLDYVQDIVVGVGTIRNEWRFADGRTERTMHKRYQALYHQVFAETLPETGGFLLTRTGCYGDQTNGVIIWPGDLDANMARHKEEVVDREGRTYRAVGGLPASMVDGLSLGPSGFPFYGSDTGGYRRCPPDRETFTRWFEQTALSSVMQIGTSCNDVAWELGGANGFDEEMLGWYRRYTRLHLRLWPYAWTLAHAMREDGRPLQRPYGLQHPELGARWDTYFFGDSLLVAPVLERGARRRLVPFPPGVWYDWWTGARIEGGAELEVAAPLDTLPLYLRAGGVVPLLRPTIDTLAPVDPPPEGPDIDTFASDAGRLYVRIAAGAPGGLTLFDGTELTHAEGRFQIEPGRVFDAGAQLEIFGLDAPQVEGLPERADLTALEATERGWFFDDERATLHVRLSPADRQITLR